MRNRILIFLNNIFKDVRAIHLIGFYLYQGLFLVMAGYFKQRFPSIVSISPRHSSIDRKNFNAFFSDIDSTFIVSDEGSIADIIAHFYKLKFFFPMFDLPEFYTKEEGEVLAILNSPTYWPYLNVIWHLRKLNWIKKNISSDQYERAKQEQAFKKSFSIVFNCPPRNKHNYHYFELNQFNEFFPQSSLKEEVCLYSIFLETTSKEAIHFLSDALDLRNFNALMPGEFLADLKLNTKNNKILMLKYAIEAREQLIANTSLRTAKVENKNLSELLQWKAFLDERDALKYFRPDA